MKRTVISLSVAFGFILFGGLLHAQAAASSHKVIVNVSNPISSMPKAEICKLFLKAVTKWENGQNVRPVDLPLTSSVRQDFSEDILDKSTAMVKKYWMIKVLSGCAPPPEKTSAVEVLHYVDADPAAIGYVPASEPVGNFKVKVLDIRE